MSNRLVSSFFSVSSFALLAVGLLCSPQAQAKKSQLRTLVVPFDGKNTGKSTIAESIELELELVESVIVKTGRSAKRDLRRAGPEGFETSALKKMMKKRKLDVVIRGMRDASSKKKKKKDVLHVYVYGKDGKPRIHFERRLPGRNLDTAAVEIVEDLAPLLNKFSKLKRVKPHYKIAAPKPEPVKEKPKAVKKKTKKKDAPSDDDFFVDFDDDKNPDAAADDVLSLDDGPKKKKKAKKKKTASKKKTRPVAGVEKPKRATISSDDDDEEDKPVRTRRRRRTLDDDDEDEDEDKPRRRRRSLDDDDEDLDEDDDEEGGRRVLGSRREKKRRTSGRLKDDVELTLPAYSKFTAEAFGALNLWSWSFVDAGGVSQGPPLSGLRKLGGGGRVEYWIKSFVGVEVSGGGSVMPEVSLKDFNVTPDAVGSTNFDVNATVKARYLYSKENSPLAFGIGLRAGYTFDLSNADQTTDGGSNTITIIPGWNYHAFRVGPEIYLAYRAFNRRFEFTGFGDFALPLYEESPDNPGNKVVAWGWNAGASLRIPVFNPAFISLSGNTRGVSATFNGTGDRQRASSPGQAPTPVLGGGVSNTTHSFALGVGVMF